MTDPERSLKANLTSKKTTETRIIKGPQKVFGLQIAQKPILKPEKTQNCAYSNKVSGFKNRRLVSPWQLACMEIPISKKRYNVLCLNPLWCQISSHQSMP